MFISDMFGDANFSLESFTVGVYPICYSIIKIYSFTNTDGDKSSWFETFSQ